MPPFISGPGLGLPLPQNLYPTQLGNAPADASTNVLCLSGGDSFILPAGDWYVSPGMYSIFEWLDPVTGQWTFAQPAGWSGYEHVTSDGFNFRIANLTGCPVGAVIQNAGSAYVQATTSIAVTGGGGSLWQPIIGGQLGNMTVTTAGAGYGVAPLVFIPPPPPAANNPNGVGGVQAAAYAVISSGTVSGITFTNPGAGYPTAPTLVLIPAPTDPNLSTGITQSVVTVTTVGSGSITGCLCTNSGAPPAAGITLTVSGAGSSGSVAAVILQTITAASVTGPGVGYGTGASGILATGGGWPLGSITNSPEFLGLRFRPRPAQITITPSNTSVSVGSLGTIIDGGLFAQAPTATWISPSGAAAPTTIGTVAFTMGSAKDIIYIQPAP